MKEYVKASSKDTETVLEIVQNSITNVYPKYYPKEVVEFFCNLHCLENIAKDIEDGLVGILLVDGICVGTGCYRENHITRVYVKPEYQGKGYAHLLWIVWKMRLQSMIQNQFWMHRCRQVICMKKEVILPRNMAGILLKIMWFWFMR